MEEIILDDNILDQHHNNPRPYAGFWIRVAASLIDGLVFIPFIAFNFYNMASLKSVELALLAILLMTAYKPLMEYYYGATLGKMAINIKVVNMDFGEINLTQAFIRYLPWLIANIITTYTTFMLYTDPEFQNYTTFTETMVYIGERGNSSIETFAGIFVFISAIAIAFNDQKQAVHDMMAKTYCVFK